jgi:hypothetical protein
LQIPCHIKVLVSRKKPDPQLADHFWGDRTGSFTGSEGYLWTVAPHKEDLTDEEISQRQDAFIKQFASTQG